jgi:NAD(P)H-dependent FMN reductase
MILDRKLYGRAPRCQSAGSAAGELIQQALQRRLQFLGGLVAPLGNLSPDAFDKFRANGLMLV